MMDDSIYIYIIMYDSMIYLLQHWKAAMSISDPTLWKPSYAESPRISVASIGFSYGPLGSLQRAPLKEI